MKTQHKIVIYTTPIFDKQHLFRVCEVSGDDEKWIVSGNATLSKIKKEIDYWFKKDN